ncbi:MAG: hypothetical protein ABSB23_14555, partial [Bryobacteraceae bacterium]
MTTTKRSTPGAVVAAASRSVNYHYRRLSGQPEAQVRIALNREPRLNGASPRVVALSRADGQAGTRNLHLDFVVAARVLCSRRDISEDILAAQIGLDVIEDGGQFVRLAFKRQPAGFAGGRCPGRSCRLEAAAGFILRYFLLGRLIGGLGLSAEDGRQAP